jgi:hypothetical protein
MGKSSKKEMENQTTFSIYVAKNEERTAYHRQEKQTKNKLPKLLHTFDVCAER